MLTFQNREMRRVALAASAFVIALAIAFTAVAALNVPRAHAVVYDSQEDLQQSEASGPVLGTYLTSDCRALLARVNEIRAEAHAEGIKVDGKVVSGEPLKWSNSLEAAAQIRAVEASLRQDHTRVNGESCFEVLDGKARCYAECLAWMWSANVEGWYSEKALYLQTGEFNAYTGHYVAMISDDYSYIGLGAFAFHGTVCTAGEFSSTDAGYGTPRPDGPAVQLINIGSNSVNACAAYNFDDIDPTGWCTTQGWLRLALVNGYMEGYKNENGTGYSHYFGPGDNLSRAQAAVILYRMANHDSTDTVNPADYAKANKTGLSDVKTGVYYTAAVNWAQEKGIITGYKDKKTGKYTAFGPDDLVTREQLATMISRFCVEYCELAPIAEADVAKALAAFPDGASIEQWAREGVAYCAAHGILSGYEPSKKFGPSDNATREQMAKIVVATAVTVVQEQAAQEQEQEQAAEAEQAQEQEQAAGKDAEGAESEGAAAEGAAKEGDKGEGAADGENATGGEAQDSNLAPGAAGEALAA